MLHRLADLLERSLEEFAQAESKDQGERRGRPWGARSRVAGDGPPATCDGRDAAFASAVLGPAAGGMAEADPAKALRPEACLVLVAQAGHR